MHAPGSAGKTKARRGFRVNSDQLSTPLNGRRSTLELMDLVAGPPEWVVQGLGKALRERLGLQLFNIDLICPRLPHPAHHHLPSNMTADTSTPTTTTYYVVDINYFPGYDKLPGWEEMLIDFLHKSAQKSEEAMQRTRGL